jgi:hypothetical protein
VQTQQGRFNLCSRSVAASHVISIAVIVFLGTCLAQGDQVFTWDSPHHLYRATDKQNDAYKISDTQITSLTDPTARPLFEMGGGAVPGILSPPVHGYWSDDDSRLIIVSGGKTDNGYLALNCQVIDKDPQTARFTVVSKDYQPSPEPVEQEAEAGIFALHPDFKSHPIDGRSVSSSRWTSENTLEIEHQLDLSTENTGNNEVQHYRTKWTATVHITDEGLLITNLGPISYAVLDAQRQPGAWQELSVPDQALLLSAVQLGHQDQVTDLLKKGVNPNAYSDVNVLSIAIGRDDPSMIESLLKAGAKVNPSNLNAEPPFNVAMMTADGRVFDLIMATHPSPSHDNSEDAYFALYSGLGLHYGALQVLDPKINPKAGSALTELQRRLGVLKLAGFDINAADDKTGETILMAAVKNHAALPILQKLVAAGANPTPTLPTTRGKSTSCGFWMWITAMRPR